jgi:hypothetical protein
MENKEKSSARLYWLWAWLVIAAVSGVPVGQSAYQNVLETNTAARHRLIVQYELWRAHPKLTAKPQAWARLASRLLTDNQLMNRVRIVHPNNAEQIELDYRRDLSIVQGLAIARYLLPWVLTLALIYGAGWWLLRPRTPAPPPKIVPASYDDPRYRE